MHSIGQQLLTAARGLSRRTFEPARAARTLALAAAFGTAVTVSIETHADFGTTPMPNGECNTGCHTGAGLTGGRRVNAAGARSVIEAGNIFHSMGFATNGTFNGSSYAAEIQAALSTPPDVGTVPNAGAVNYTSGTAATAYVAYGGTVNVTLPNLLLTGVVDTLQQTTGVSGVSFPTADPPVMRFAHSGGAGGNCNNAVITSRGIGALQTGTAGYTVAPQTTGRTVTVVVNSPSAPSAPGTGSISIPYSTSATLINVRSLDSGSVTGTVSATGTDVQIVSGLSPAVGTISTTATGTNENTFSYTANATTYAPQLTLQYRVQGPCTTNSATQTLTINVGTPTNPPIVTNRGSVGTPIVVSATAPTPIDMTANISGLTQSNPAVAYALTASQPTPAAAGSTSVVGNVVTFTPLAGFTGTATFTFQKAGPGGTSLPATAFLNVTASPIVSPTSVTTAFNTPVAVNLATACGGATCISSSQPVTAVTPSSPTNGTASATATATITFTPTTGFFGTGSFQYTATNAGGTSVAPATVTVTVNPPPPTAGNGTVGAPYNSGAPVVATAIDLAPFIGPAGATVLSVAPGGAVNGTVSATGPTTVSFTPTVGFIGAASFTYTATNVAGTSAGSGTITVNVAAPPPPVAAAQSVLVSSTAPTTFDLASSVSGLFTPPLQVLTQPSSGTVAFTGTSATFTPPAAGVSGNLTFTYRAVGPGGPSAAGTVTLRSVNTPVASNISASTLVNTAARIDLSDSFAGFVQNYRISRLPANGSATINSAVVIYTPNTGFIGTDTFEFTGTGPGGTSTPGVATITVIPPVAEVTGLSVSTPFNTPVTIDLTKAVSGFASSFTLAGRADNGIVVISGTTAVYTPNNGFSGGDRFRIIAVNASGASAPGTVNVNVGTLAPTGRAATLTVAVNGQGTLDLAPFIVGSGVTGITISTLPEHGIADVEGTRLIYTPRTGFFGSDSFEYVAFGNAGRSPPVRITVVIDGRPDPSQDKNVQAIVDNQAQVARRFSRAQITNFQRRMETLHVPGPVTPSAAPDEDPADVKKPAAATPKAPSAGFANGFVPPAAMLPGSPARATPGSVESTFANGLSSLANARALSLNASTDGSRPPGMMSGINFWVGGTASFGTRSLGDDQGPYAFSTDGLSLGADRRLDERLAVGLGMGFARDRSDLGGDGTKNKSRGSSFAAYGSYHPSPRTYVDALVGFGTLKFDSERYVEAFDESFGASRKGNQFFASVAGGYEHRVRNFLISPYGRIDVTVDRLKGATEGGTSPAALTYEEQKLRTTSAAAGLRLESTHETDYGRVVPRARFEYRHDFEGGRTANVSYADQFGGLTYSVSPAGTSRNALLVGVGSDFLLSSGWKLGLDYQGERSSGPGTVQSVRFLVSKDLDGKGLPAWSGWTMPLRIPVNVDFGMVWDDNISRGRLDEEIRSDRVYTLNVNRAYEFPINKNARVIATALFTVDKPHTYTGLGHYGAGAQAEAQYRRSGDFDAATYSIYARALYDKYESDLRTGPKYSFGANVRRALTDRIDLFADLSHHRRFGRSSVFETSETAGRVNFDYSLGKNGTLYLSGEYRKGDIFSSGFASLTNIAIAEVATADDAFPGGEFFAYRFDGKTVLGTFGYNRPLGARDAIDFSIRRVQSTPSLRPEFDEGGRLRYIVNQYSLLYLLRF
ncbi:MAG: autotransporter domain-containing protein [Betaproteobacteria bacterium]|nr:autotransporter domain-containing protein [Betaproteobacteria bacterium]